MSTTVVRCVVRSFEGSRPLALAEGNRFNPQENRVHISQKRAMTARIFATFDVAGRGTDSVGEWNAEDRPGNGRKQDELCSTTRNLDSRLMQAVNRARGPVRQIVLMTDGTDTRPYRLDWPSPSVIFDVSPVQMHDTTLRKMTAFGLKIPRSCLLKHVPMDFSLDDNEDEDWGQKLIRMGYSGDKPSVWILEMPNHFLDGYLQKILPVASCLLMKDSVFMGVVPANFSSEVESRAYLSKLFASHGFLAEFEAHGNVDSRWTLEGSAKQTSNLSQPLFLTFFARQLRLSDSQVEYVQMQIMLAEDAGDEDGFEDSW